MSRKVRGTGSRNLAHAILREAHLGCTGRGGKKGLDGCIQNLGKGAGERSAFAVRKEERVRRGGGTHERKMEVSKVQEGGRRRRGRISPTTGVGERRVSSRGKKNDPLI